MRRHGPRGRYSARAQLRLPRAAASPNWTHRRLEPAKTRSNSLNSQIAPIGATHIFTRTIQSMPLALARDWGLRLRFALRVAKPLKRPLAVRFNSLGRSIFSSSPIIPMV